MSNPLRDRAARLIAAAYDVDDDPAAVARALDDAGLLAYQDRLTKARARRDMARRDAAADAHAALARVDDYATELAALATDTTVDYLAEEARHYSDTIRARLRGQP